MKKSIMWNHIYEETNKLKTLLASTQVEKFLEIYDTKAIKKMIFVASGSSLNIATVAKKFYGDLAQIDVSTYTPSEFIFNSKMLDSFNKETTLVVAISQTGTSSGTINSISCAKELGYKVLSITERRNTPAQEMSDYYLNFLSDLEDCNAKTKGFSNSLTLLEILAIQIAKEKAVITDETFKAYMDEIKASIDDIPSTIENTEKWLHEHKDWSAINHLLVIGNGTNYGVAVEGMLKILETLCIPASICELGEFSHGFHRTITNNSNVITIFTDEPGKDNMKRTNEYLIKKAGKLLVINATKEVIKGDNYINVVYRPLTASSLNISVVFQVIATALPEIIGHDPNYPMNEDYTKIVGTRV
ncbi:SIS domain-containing protein [Clostridium bowmanii]|uniref:SIS domain-containing protein n=1 Tax=Clostridium bowmanii TaxID=132925 RepID=UPI001C0BC18F|nr:SIS domain-containing protein [Clostridium bowmanii]MBU3188260.1 SIS domain-containing protein [Clostridium bowmanii]MCA1072646.1 SIS domain-containing protein [Clostridium bowmanii]